MRSVIGTNDPLMILGLIEVTYRYDEPENQ
jgi:hypothetical protein